jgi:hypothetical protein
MMVLNLRHVTSHCVLHVLARATSLVMLGLIALFSMGEGVPNILKISIPETLELLALFGTCLGLVLAWRWERAGGLASLANLATFTLVELSVNRRPPGLAFAVMAIPGLLFLSSSLLPKARPMEVPA